ncbi:30S ribosomal protein S16 [Candidatus Jorgensenbacteria bacterium RIFCSPLOWO2_12_FULL_42_11]|uniref:Small ribosomal subunit protein bS16 n=1 Tax=Candidatus Jorgensenbacteria bacterium RIFCSPLOWO2_12_FULL_42_11 TaxID=1798473 RepID=A0A1F6C3Z3_9BACT|nr:MAG: 30S ribosomal protein S16 [Candidatus Jorgensenbacteria bacterium RIFCSPLOWO2_12_FULL_42_11]
MLAIKFKRIGKKKQASFRVIVAEKRSKINGRFIEDLGWFNPHTDKSRLDIERVNYWVKNGAQPTSSIKNLLKKQES